MRIHEVASYELLNKYGVKTPVGIPATTAAEARQAAASLGGGIYVVKAQILAGGRGKGRFDTGFESGVHIVKTLDAVENVAAKMLGNKLITKQTGPKGLICNKVMITEMLSIKEEYYFAIVADRKSGSLCAIASREGGVNIEEVAERYPNAIKKVFISSAEGITDAGLSELVEALGLIGENRTQGKELIAKLYQVFTETDATQVEINPLVLTGDGRLLCGDAKLNFDANAAFRQPELFSQRDYSQENPHEVMADKAGLSYVGLDGNIGCLVNGAGLAMATMDLINTYNGKPANFLDVGGGASVESITEAFRIITSNPKVTAILVNIFGGIVSCNTIAEGIKGALQNVNVKIPLVIRLQGNHSEQAGQVLATLDTETPVIAIPDLDNAAKAAVALASYVQRLSTVHQLSARGFSHPTLDLSNL
eukprot:TRINITY_DN65621_c9_g5_i2.p1 TRINITY_DN65621_c9_g5~~TRINITY_DN65621_c9_g5_i2.p1  ORF type:complete len:456 (+),score=52.23 TRINITY_DN65621_c9_g5_i2:103-1368(+)